MADKHTTISSVAERDRPADSLGGIEQRDDIADKILQLNQRWKNGLAVHDTNADLIENYVGGKLCLGLRCVSGIDEQYGFVFQVVNGNTTHSIGETNSFAHHEIEAWMHCASNQPLVLAQNVELMEGPKKIIPSFVWVERFDDRNFSGGKPLFAFDPVKWIDHVLSAGEDGEMRIAARRYAVACSKRGTKKIKGTSERSYDGAEFGMEDRGQFLFRSRYGRDLAGWRILIYRHQLHIACLPDTKPAGEDWELGFAPLDSSYGVR